MASTRTGGPVTEKVFDNSIVQLAALCPICALAALSPAAALSALSPTLALFNPAINPRAALLSFQIGLTQKVGQTITGSILRHKVRRLLSR